MKEVIKTKTVEFGNKGEAVAKITVNYYEETNNFEGYEMGVKVKKIVKVEVIANGKVVSEDSGTMLLYEEDAWRPRELPDGIVISSVGGAHAIGAETYNRAVEALAELTAEAQAEFGEKSNEENKVEAEEIKEVKKAEKIIELAEEAGIENLKTDAQLKQKQEIYNQIQNEGSKLDGNYIPTEITSERYQRAKKLLEKMEGI